MNESKENRVFKLEKRQSVSDQKEYCSCECHWKTLGDFVEITDKFAEEVFDIVEGFGSFQRGDFVDARKDTEV